MSERKETWRRGAGRGSSRWRNGGTGAAAGGAGAARWPQTLTRRRSRRPSPPPALEESPLHEQDLAKLVSEHFSDVLQQIADRDENVGDAEEDDDGEEEAL